jgi:hypothetical protein
MNYIDAVLSMIPNEPNSNIGYYSDDNELIEAIQKRADELLSEAINLKESNIRRLPYGGEFFEFILFEDDEAILDRGIAKQLEFAIQKNRTFAVLTSSLEVEKLQAIYTDLNFTHIEPIELGDRKVFTMRKWFKL